MIGDTMPVDQLQHITLHIDLPPGSPTDEVALRLLEAVIEALRSDETELCNVGVAVHQTVPTGTPTW
jgi:hypothetical protein